MKRQVRFGSVMIQWFIALLFGTMLVSPPAIAKVIGVAVDITNAIPPDNSFGMDFNRDGAEDIRFYHEYSFYDPNLQCCPPEWQWYLSAKVPGIGAVITESWIWGPGMRFATVLAPGDLIDASRQYEDGPNDTTWISSIVTLAPGRNDWWNGGYVGMNFLIEGELHYAWLYLQTTSSGSSVHISGYGYEDQPGVGIAAGALPIPGALILFISGFAILLGSVRRTFAAA